VAQVMDAAEDRGDSPVRPADRVLDCWEGPRLAGRGGEAVEQLAHEVAAAVVKARDLVRIAHRVLRRMLDGGARHAVNRVRRLA
jgi:hypothetical protein